MGIIDFIPALIVSHPRCQPPSLPQRSWSLSFCPSFCLTSFFWLFFDDSAPLPLPPKAPRWCPFNTLSDPSPWRLELPVAANRLYDSVFEAKRFIDDRGFSMASWARSDSSVSLTGRFCLLLGSVSERE